MKGDEDKAVYTKKNQLPVYKAVVCTGSDCPRVCMYSVEGILN